MRRMSIERRMSTADDALMVTLLRVNVTRRYFRLNLGFETSWLHVVHVVHVVKGGWDRVVGFFLLGCS